MSEHTPGPWGVTAPLKTAAWGVCAPAGQIVKDIFRANRRPPHRRRAGLAGGVGRMVA